MNAFFNIPGSQEGANRVILRVSVDFNVSVFQSYFFPDIEWLRKFESETVLKKFEFYKEG